ncbi:hypothetical protein HDU80_001848, partial [Chytriomyces hyalinus]
MINPAVAGNISYADYDHDQLDTQWNAVTIVVSVAISYAGAMYTILLNEARGRPNSLSLFIYKKSIDPPVSKFYSGVLLLLSSLSLSIRAIFFMHFVGMTAVTLHIHETGTRVPIYFDYGYTVLSAVVCGLTILWAFHYASQDEYWNTIVHDRTKLAEKIMAREVAKTMALKKRAEKKMNHGSKHGKSVAPGSQTVSAAPFRTSGVTRSMGGARDSATRAHTGHDIKATAEFDNQMEAIVESTALLPQDSLLSPHVQPLHPDSAQNSSRRLSTKFSNPSLSRDGVGSTNVHKDDSTSGELVQATPPHTPQPHGKSPRNWIAKGWESLPRPQLPPPHMTQIPINYPSADASIRYDVGPAFPSRDRPKESSTQLDSFHMTGGTGGGGGGEQELTIDVLILFEKPWRIVISGFFIASAVLAMHHLGMYSMRMQADQIFNPVIVAISVVIAVVAATAGMFIIFRILPYYPYEVVKYTAAVIIAIAVNGMHYTGMAAVNYTFKHIPDFDPSGFIEPIHLAEVILYSEVIINIVSEAVLRQDNDLVLNLYRARAQAAF